MGCAPVITQTEGNLLAANVDALVNTVNTVGVMGKGIALQFKRAYPEMFTAYVQAVKRGEVRIGRMHVWPTGQLSGPRFVINFPTKQHWRGKSSLDDIDRGLDDLVRVVRELRLDSIAVPPLGCGNGGLSWGDVQPLIERKLVGLAEVNVQVFAPGGAPPAAEMVTAERRPDMTVGRAALVAIMSAYAEHAMQMPSLIETQKLVYFLQRAGEPLQLHFVKHHYGPYADNLRKVLRVVEGHYVSGFGDGSKLVRESEPLIVLPEALAAAEPVLHEHPETQARIDRVLALAEGFESAYGLELLASVAWVVDEESGLAEDEDALVRSVQGWTQRKGRMFTREHILTAWRALRARGWAPTPVSA